MRGPGAIAFGVVCVLLGGLWVLQGIGLVGGSFMTGSALWLFIGVVVLLGGIGLVVRAARAGRGPRS